jgi:peptidoglycan hydrolase-like protein with peptidoglycan-binding domain
MTSIALKHRVLPSQAKAVRADLAKLTTAVGGSETLALGDTGAGVSALQRRLKALDLYAGPVNGSFDAATEAAVKKLEGQSKVAADGVVDAAEVAALKKRELFVKDGFETRARVGQKGSDIRAVEQKLKMLGFHPGAVDGIFDAKLQAALLKYRKSDQKVPDGFKGIIGPKVLKGLRGQVKHLEGNLKKLGRKPGKVDGTYTSATEAAVKAFQKKHKLPVTGIANAKTRAAIEKAAHPGSGPITDRTKKFIAVAKAQIGDPYVFGAQGPNAFDCSGLIHYALKGAGVNDARTTARGYQARFAGSKVSRENLKPGDLLFYWSPNTRGIPRGQASHIEIYLGHGLSMGTDNPSEGARVERVNWASFIGGARVPALQRG